MQPELPDFGVVDVGHSTLQTVRNETEQYVLNRGGNPESRIKEKPTNDGRKPDKLRGGVAFLQSYACNVM